MKGCCYRKLCAGSCINPTLSFAGLQSSILESLPSCTCPMSLFMPSTSPATRGPTLPHDCSTWIMARYPRQKAQELKSVPPLVQWPIALCPHGPAALNRQVCSNHTAAQHTHIVIAATAAAQRPPPYRAQPGSPARLDGLQPTSPAAGHLLRCSPQPRRAPRASVAPCAAGHTPPARRPCRQQYTAAHAAACAGTAAPPAALTP